MPAELVGVGGLRLSIHSRTTQGINIHSVGVWKCSAHLPGRVGYIILHKS